MARYDVHQLRDSDNLVLDIQSDILDHLETRVVVPLMPPAGIPEPLGRLHPSFDVNGQSYILATQLIGAVPLRSLGKRVVSLNAEHYAISAALDMLIAGY